MPSVVRRRLEKVSEKELSNTDVECRLAFPCKHVHHFCTDHQLMSSPSIDFQVEDVEGSRFELRLSIRSGRYKKPEVKRGWLNMVRCKGLKKHDKLIFYKHHPAGNGDLRFTVAVRRAVRLFGVVIGHSAAEE